MCLFSRQACVFRQKPGAEKPRQQPCSDPGTGNPFPLHPRARRPQPAPPSPLWHRDQLAQQSFQWKGEKATCDLPANWDLSLRSILGGGMRVGPVEHPSSPSRLLSVRSTGRPVLSWHQPLTPDAAPGRCRGGVWGFVLSFSLSFPRNVEKRQVVYNATHCRCPRGFLRGWRWPQGRGK